MSNTSAPRPSRRDLRLARQAAQASGDTANHLEIPQYEVLSPVRVPRHARANISSPNSHGSVLPKRARHSLANTGAPKDRGIASDLAATEQTKSSVAQELRQDGSAADIFNVVTASVMSAQTPEEIAGQVHTLQLSSEQIREAINQAAREVSREHGRRRPVSKYLMAGAMTLAVSLAAGAGLMLSIFDHATAASPAMALENPISLFTRSDSQTPQSLTKVEGASDSARYAQASEQHPVNPQCPASTGASSLDSAFRTEERVVYPMEAGKYQITSPFGPRIDPIDGSPSFHTGADFAGAVGTPVYAIADGVVIHAGEGIKGRSSQLIIIRHTINGKEYTSWYVHMYDDGVFVKKGDKVTAGQKIAAVGSQGWSTGPHLHFEVHRGGDIDHDELLDPVVALNDFGAVHLNDSCPAVR
ncbi:M23 family metallopeptidase [Trueperella sp. LYQ143]|uniref:M23 family metallopeptidase n=1 Tax=unclassified Trueperella TaxID=2630174 RepID=UPI0039834592